jgi:ketosteroid isomerase-like protein
MALATALRRNFEMTMVYTVRKGRIFYLESFWDHGQALETLGLSE